MGITACLHENIERLPVLIDRPQQVIALAPNLDEQLIQMPDVAWSSTPVAELLGEGLPELERPEAHGLVTDNHAPFGEELVDFAETEAKAMIEPHCMGNDFGRKATILVGVCGV